MQLSLVSYSIKRKKRKVNNLMRLGVFHLSCLEYIYVYIVFDKYKTRIFILV
jgi:hypothetical protein